MKKLANKKNWIKPEISKLSVKNLTHTGDLNTKENGASAKSGPLSS